MFECKECSAPLAFDQRYCMTCGARRGALPARASKLLAPLDMPVPPAIAGVPPMFFAPPASAAPNGALAALDDWVDNFEIPTPRVMASAALALLAVGVLLGGIVGNGNGLGPIVMLPNPSPAAATTPAAAAAETPAAAAAGPATEIPAATEATGATPPAGATPKVNHVWLIVLGDQGYAKTFGDPNSQSYLITDLASQGAVVPNYYAVAQGQLANRVALVSGQQPTWQLTQNCPRYTDVAPGTLDAATNTLTGDGCVFPDTVRTIGDAVAGTGKTWATYVEGAENSAGCAAPAANAENTYVNKGNPFAYFKGVIASPNCPYSVYGLDALSSDLTAAKSPALSVIIPSACHSGSDTPCSPGAATGLASTDDFLRDVVPKIMSSQDYLDGGLIAITFDQAPQGVAGADTSGCCGQPAYPNLDLAPTDLDPTPATGATGATGETGATGDAGATGQTGPASIGPFALPTYVKTQADGSPAGGGKVGLLLISKMIPAGKADITDDYNHYSLLNSIENWFGTEKLGFTSQVGTGALPDTIFSAAGATGATG